jgi:4-hydroxy-2-oxoheptanedioate aldolase
MEDGPMNNTAKNLRWLAACLLTVWSVVCLVAETPKAKRINRAIDLLAQGQPIYYTGSHEGTDGSFEQGVKDAQTYADYISYDMEHAPFDVKGLAEYMRGLAKGGPTRSGHATPAVIVNVPVNGIDEAAVHANAWMFQQVLATGVHGILLCHADTPGAVRAFVEAVRFPANGGRRGVHGNSTAARIWGVSADEYAQKADVWPLNPNGELLLGLKLEDKYALENADANA